MLNVLRLILILALSISAVLAPDVSSASEANMAMANMTITESADERCGGCDPSGLADGIPCEGGCPVPCGAGGTAGIAAGSAAPTLAMSFGVVVRVVEYLIPVGANPPLDPFPPRLPV